MPPLLLSNDTLSKALGSLQVNPDECKTKGCENAAVSNNNGYCSICQTPLRRKGR
jgi:hypothetical protein